MALEPVMNFLEGLEDTRPMNHKSFLHLTESDRFHAMGVGSCAALPPLIKPESASNASEAAVAPAKVHNRL